MQARSITASYNRAVHVPRFFAAEAAADVLVRLSADESAHLTRVLRLGPGAMVIVFDGAGHEWDASVAGAQPNAATLERHSPRNPAPEPRVSVTLAVALLKGDQMDAVVRDATALGVTAVRPILSAHVVVPARAWKRAGAVERWHRVAVASAKQCERAVIPAILPIAAYADVWRDVTDQMRVLCTEPALPSGSPASLLPPPRSALVCVGPEGGWSAAEVALARAGDARILTLGPRTLRADLVPAVALSALWTHWGWS
jgi:16S rRNA (uracil1498-N3)-methyltransferase